MGAEEEIEFFQELVDTNEIHGLPASYVRRYRALVARGDIEPHPDDCADVPDNDPGP